MAHEVCDVIEAIDDKLNSADGLTIAAVARLLGINIVYIDGSGYYAALMTQATFGCNQHEAK